jgi:pimeloyl-ACP methyl ester carboxylesterase
LKRNQLVTLFIALPLLSLGCTSSDSKNNHADAGGTGADAGVSLIEIPCSDSAVDAYAAQTKLGGAKGSILKCAKDVDISQDVLNADATAAGYVGKSFVSGARAYRISYVTERATNPATPGFGSAVVYIPDAPAAAKTPIAVVAHGTGGQGTTCSPSQDAAGMEKGGEMYMVRPLVGMGIPVIVPDYAGFAGYGATGNPPSGYAFSADVGRSMLDAARALQKIVPSRISDQVVLVGHSQGGHTTLSALAMAETYAPELNIVAAVAYAPLWFSALSWGALLGLPDLFPMKNNSFAIAVAIWYHYSHAEILDGPGAGAALFAPDKRAALKDFVDNMCKVDDGFKSLGNTIADLIDPALIGAVGSSAAAGSPCDTTDPAAQAICEKWNARYKADRPHLKGKAATTPLLVLYGDSDTTIPAGRAMCGFDRLHADNANVSICVQTGADHTPLVYMTSSYVSEWIAARTLGGPEPAKCERDETTLKDPSTGKEFICATPPPNDKD